MRDIYLGENNYFRFVEYLHGCVDIDTILDSCECIDCCVWKQLCLHGNFLRKETLDKSQNHNLETILDSYDVPAVARNVFA